MRIANISVSLSLALPMWAWDIKPPATPVENIYLENKMPKETRPIYWQWMWVPQTDGMQISRKVHQKGPGYPAVSCFLPRQHLTLGSEEFYSLAEFEMWFTVVTAHTNAAIPWQWHCKTTSSAAFVSRYKIWVCWLLSDTSPKIWCIKDKRRWHARLDQAVMTEHPCINSDGAGLRLKFISASVCLLTLKYFPLLSSAHYPFSVFHSIGYFLFSLQDHIALICHNASH